VNIIVPMAYAEPNPDISEFQYPKPLIDLHGKPLIEYVIENISSIKGINKIYFIVNEATCAKYHLDNTITLLSDKAEIIYLKSITSGSVCSILMGIDEIPKEEECIIVNSDQILITDLNEHVGYFKENGLDAGVITFNSVHPRWSYVLMENKKAVQFAEKNPISKNAIAGFYYFKSFLTFMESACKTIVDDDQLDGKFYVSSVLNQLILSGLNISNSEIAANNYLSLYSNQKIKEFDAYLTKQNL
jgi:NDP-sugar pyrophosphorylase family protein